MVSLHGRTRLKGGDQAHTQSQNKIGHVGLPIDSIPYGNVSVGYIYGLPYKAG